MEFRTSYELVMKRYSIVIALSPSPLVTPLMVKGTLCEIFAGMRKKKKNPKTSSPVEKKKKKKKKTITTNQNLEKQNP